jgi:hypothetical protein
MWRKRPKKAGEKRSRVVSGSTRNASGEYGMVLPVITTDDPRSPKTNKERKWRKGSLKTIGVPL